VSTPIVRPDPARSNPLPFAPLPHALNEDPRIKPRAVRIANAILKHARAKAWCNPCNRTLAAACRCGVRTVQLALAELRDAGWLRIEQGPGGRVIWLTWREGPPRNDVQAPPRNDVQAPPRNGPRDPAQRVPSPPRNGPHPKQKAGEGEGRNVTSLPPPGGAAASPGRPQEPRPGPSTTPRPPAPVRPLLDELKGLPGADVPKVRAVAWRLAHHLTDVASVAFFTLVLGLVATGSAPLQRLLDAFRVADRSRGGVRKPGAIFATTWSGWTPPPKPSEINRPTSHRAPATIPRPEPPPPDGTGDELAELERLIAAGGPVARMARARLAELRAGVAAEGRPAEAAPRA